MVDQQNINAIQQSTENKIVNKALTVPTRPYISGMELKADIHLGDLTFNTIDEHGVIWVCTDVEGWWEHPEPTFTDIPRGLGDGSYDVRGRYAARQISLTGVFLTPDASYVQAARDKLARAADLVYTGAWFRADEVPTKAAWVRLNGKPSIKTVNNRGRTEFTIGLKAADPVKYEWIDNSPEGYDSVDLPCKNTGAGHSGSVTVTNKGNVKVPVLIEVTGQLTCTPANPAKIINTTRSETIDIVAAQPAQYTPSAPGSVLTDTLLAIDTYNREVLYNDVALDSRSRISILAQWIYLDPGANVITFEDTSKSNSTASCRILFRSGWIA